MNTSTLVQKLWNYCNVLRDDGMSYGDYVEQLTYLLFLKMADERSRPPYDQPSLIPAKYAWPKLVALDGDDLFDHYRHTLEELGKGKGTLGLIFGKAQNKFQDPAKLRRVIVDLIDAENNVEQIDGLPAHHYTPTAPRDDSRTLELIEEAEDFFAATGATFRHGGNRVFCAPAADFIQLPPAVAFKDAESYAAAKAHELTHWTGHQSRLARTFGKRFGDQAYAFEELVAELGAAFLYADLGITPEPREDHASYLAHWLDVLKANKRAIFTAAAHAQRAADFLAGLVKTAEEQPEPLAA